MPTKRAWIFLIIAAALYFLANQTQVGWLYVITAGIVGLLLVSFFYSRGMLKRLRINRAFRRPSPTQPTNSTSPANGRALDDPGGSELAPPTFHEDDPLDITLQVGHAGWRPALLVHGSETCPCAPPPDQSQPFFIPTLFKDQSLDLTYQTYCDRRGLFTFPPIHLTSTGPVGLFRTQRTLNLPDQLLIYPAYHPLKRLRLLEQRGLSERQSRRVGTGGDVIGTREYRAGDSLRQIHWRSTARIGKLVVKEFADEEQLTLTIILDLAENGNLGRGKFSTFETAIRLAASFGYYATHNDIPFYLIGTDQQGQLPRMALSWWSALNLLAKVKNDGQTSLADLLRTLPISPVVVVLASRPTPAIARAMAALSQAGTRTLAIFITPDGATPEEAANLGRPELEVRTASPYNWVEMLETL
jgi:uncharacterized protein (DUF58 family)